VNANLPLWDLAGHVARARHPRATASLDLRQPRQGLHVTAWDAAPRPSCHVLGTEFDDDAKDEAPDAYVRGGDLIATYPATPDRSSRVQTYWRLRPDDDRLVVDVQVSVQTHRLDALPRVRLVSRTPPGKIARLDWPSPSLVDCPAGRHAANSARGHCVLVVRGADWAYVEMIHPHDLLSWTADSAASGAVLTHDLFDEQLEKGVILRARLRGVFAAGDVEAEALATDAYHAFLAEPLPLST
jgi:hypothetical protein